MEGHSVGYGLCHRYVCACGHSTFTPVQTYHPHPTFDRHTSAKHARFSEKIPSTPHILTTLTHAQTQPSTHMCKKNHATTHTHTPRIQGDPCTFTYKARTFEHMHILTNAVSHTHIHKHRYKYRPRHKLLSILESVSAHTHTRKHMDTRPQRHRHTHIQYNIHTAHCESGFWALTAIWDSAVELWGSVLGYDPGWNGTFTARLM